MVAGMEGRTWLDVDQHEDHRNDEKKRRRLSFVANEIRHKYTQGFSGQANYGMEGIKNLHD